MDAISYTTGPFWIRLEADYPPLIRLVRLFYPGVSTDPCERVHHFHLRVRRSHSLRRWMRPQAHFMADHEVPFEPYPLDHAFPFLEWGLNWCIATRAHHYLMLHSGCVAWDDHALLLPATPGSGKSTLSAALALRGWRLLSDEFGLYDPERGDLLPLPRAVPLKNRSIGIIRAFDSRAVIGPTFPKTRKGDVAHFRPPEESLSRQREHATPRWIVFPRFIEGNSVQLERLPRSFAFTRLAQNSFNYSLLQSRGFSALTRLVACADCYALRFGDLDGAVQCLSELASAR